MEAYTYIIIGSAVAGAAAAQGIREIDTRGSVLMIGNEAHLPYNRPPLTKDLWFGKKKLEQIFVNPQEYYTSHQIQLALGATVVKIDPDLRIVTDNQGREYQYEKLLLATGGTPRRLEIPGADLPGICYYRYLDDYFYIREQAKAGASAVVIGGGFIGSEIAAALNHSQLQVSMIFPGDRLVDRVFPEGLGRVLTDQYRQRGIEIVNDTPTAFEKQGNHFVTHLKSGGQRESDALIVGIGITPNTRLANEARLELANGIAVNEYLQTSNPYIFAAGDNAFFPYIALDQPMRIEHWDNALNQGKQAGRNMADANERFSYMPYFFSDLFEFGYEAVGDVNTRLETFADWIDENKTGVIYYLKDSRVRGVMLCNVWGKVDAARDLIKRGERMTPDQLRGAIRPQEKAA